MAPLPFVPLFRKEDKEDKEAEESRRCSCRPTKKDKDDVPFPSPQTAQLNNEDLLIDNTTVETTLFSYTIPAGHLDGNHGARVTIDFALKNNTGGLVNFPIRVYYGATELVELAAGALSSAAEKPNRLTFEILAKNSDSVQEIFGQQSIFAPSTFYGTAAEDATAVLDLTVTVQMDTASPNAWFLHRRSIVELL